MCRIHRRITGEEAHIAERRRLALCRGWSLPELLTVLGIIGLVLAIVVPAAWTAREYSRKAICIARLHTLHAAIMAYTEDHGRRLPVVEFFDYSRHPDSWSPAHAISRSEFVPPWPDAPEPPHWYSLRVSLGDYVDDPSVFFCPSHPRPLDGWAQFPEWCWMSYSENDGMAALRLDELTWPPDYACLLACPGKLHFGRENLLFLSGRVAAYRVPCPFICLRTPWERIRRTVTLPP